jgi:hypothetical protein
MTNEPLTEDSPEVRQALTEPPFNRRWVSWHRQGIRHLVDAGWHGGGTVTLCELVVPPQDVEPEVHEESTDRNGTITCGTCLERLLLPDADRRPHPGQTFLEWHEELLNREG